MTFGDQIFRQKQMKVKRHEWPIYCEQSHLACQL